MNENQRDTENRPDEGKQVQQELERQLREFGDTMSDAFRHGFEGRGEEIGDRVWDVGRAAVDAANYGINAAGRAVREGRQACQRQAEKAARAADGSGSAWARQFFARKPEPTPVENIRASAKKRHNAGVALLAVGITFAVIFGISAISCFGAAAMFAPSTLLGDAVATEGDVITQVFVAGGEAIGSFAMGAIWVSGWVFTAITALFGWMTAAGASRMRAGKKLNLYADMAEEFDYQKGLSLEMLADLTHQKKQKALKALRGYIHKGWLSAWLDEKDEKLYLTAEDYRAAQEARKAAEQAPRPEPQPEEAESAVPLNLEVARSFAQVLKKEKPSCRTSVPWRSWITCRRPPRPSATGWKPTRRACPRPAVLQSIISPPPSSSCTLITMCRASRGRTPRPSAGISPASCIRSTRPMITSTISF